MLETLTVSDGWLSEALMDFEIVGFLTLFYQFLDRFSSWLSHPLRIIRGKAEGQ